MIGAPGIALAGPAALGIGPLGLGGLGLAAPLGVRVTATNLRVAPAGSPVGVLVPAGSGLEGQWVPDINEKLSDDGSYKPEIYGAWDSCIIIDWTLAVPHKIVFREEVYY